MIWVTGRVSTGRLGNSLEQFFPWVLNSFDTLFLKFPSRFLLVSFSCLNAFRFFLLNLVWGLHFWRFPSYQVNFTSLAVAVRLGSDQQTICTGRCTPKGTTLGSQANPMVFQGFSGTTHRILQSFSQHFPVGFPSAPISIPWSRRPGHLVLQEAEKIRNASGWRISPKRRGSSMHP